MNLETIKTAVSNKTARQVLLAQKHSPKVLFAAGVVGVVGTVVLACRATLKVSDVLDEHDKVAADLNAIEPETGNKELSKLKVKTALEISKLYLPALGVGVISIAALTGSHVILTKRNAAIGAAYAAAQKGYDEYRERVRKELGIEKDREFAFGGEAIVTTEKLADGTTKTSTKTSLSTVQIGKSPYAVVFDERSHHFSGMPGMNANTIQMKQLYANDALRARGHLFLNEVYDMLDLPRTKAGNIVGWVYRSDSEPKNGDNYIDFGVFSGEQELVEDFIDGRYNYAVLDFNVDGNILDLI